jgi:hypothetical protein
MAGRIETVQLDEEEARAFVEALSHHQMRMADPIFHPIIRAVGKVKLAFQPTQDKKPLQG